MPSFCGVRHSTYVFDRKCNAITKNLTWFLRKLVFGTPIEDARPDMRAVQEVQALNK